MPPRSDTFHKITHARHVLELFEGNNNVDLTWRTDRGGLEFFVECSDMFRRGRDSERINPSDITDLKKVKRVLTSRRVAPETAKDLHDYWPHLWVSMVRNWCLPTDKGFDPALLGHMWNPPIPEEGFEVPDIIELGKGISVEPVEISDSDRDAFPYHALILRDEKQSQTNILPLNTPRNMRAPHVWTVKSWDPLTIGPSVNVPEMDLHSWIEEGVWK